MMSRMFLVSLTAWMMVLAASVRATTDDTCQVMMGVAQSNPICSEAIVSEIMLYGHIAHKKECNGNHTSTSGARKLTSANALEYHEQRERNLNNCNNYYVLCYVYGDYYSCMMYNSGCRRRRTRALNIFNETVEETTNSTVPVSTTTTQAPPTTTTTSSEVAPNPFGPGWQSCHFDFHQFVMDVSNNFMSQYATSDLLACWSFMFCQVHYGTLAGV